MNVINQSKAIKLLDNLIERYKAEGLIEILPDCDVFGSPELNLLYIEIYICSTKGQSLLATAGSGIFLENLLNQLWIKACVHQQQRANKFDSWDEFMKFEEEKVMEIENKVSYKEVLRPVLEKILDPEDLKNTELLREFVRHAFVHFKVTQFIKTLQQNGVLTQKMPLAKLNTRTMETSQDELRLTHPLIAKFGFKKLADQIAPAMLIFVYDLFKKYHKYLAPLEDQKIGFSGHGCEYD